MNTKNTKTISGAVKFNIAFSIIAFVFGGMLLDMGVVSHIVSVGILMYWISLFVVWKIRKHTKQKVSKNEIMIAYAGLLFATVISMLVNAVLSQIDTEPGWYYLLNAIRS